MILCTDCKFYEAPASKLSPAYCHLTALPPMLRNVIGSNMILPGLDGCDLGQPVEAHR
jgi:hypothetical protein